MFGRWGRQLIWHPFELACRRRPLLRVRATVTELVPGVRAIRFDNAGLRLLTRIGGGFDYPVAYLVGDELLVDTAFPWAGRALQQTLARLGVLSRLTHVVNTHAHEDHVGNNDILARSTSAQLLAPAAAVATVRWPAQLPWYRAFAFGPLSGSRVAPLGPRLELADLRFDVIPTPGHTPDHVCLFEPDRGWLFAGDLYVDEHLAAQLSDVDGPSWIASLERVIALEARVLFDGHGRVVLGSTAVRDALEAKRRYLASLEARTRQAATSARSLPDLTRRVFAGRGVVERLSRHEGWESVVTASDFSRSHLVGSFVRASRDRQARDRSAVH